MSRFASIASGVAILASVSAPFGSLIEGEIFYVSGSAITSPASLPKDPLTRPSKETSERQRAGEREEPAGRRPASHLLKKAMLDRASAKLIFISPYTILDRNERTRASEDNDREHLVAYIKQIFPGTLTQNKFGQELKPWKDDHEHTRIQIKVNHGHNHLWAIADIDLSPLRYLRKKWFADYGPVDFKGSTNFIPVNVENHEELRKSQVSFVTSTIKDFQNQMKCIAPQIVFHSGKFTHLEVCLDLPESNSGKTYEDLSRRIASATLDSNPLPWGPSQGFSGKLGTSKNFERATVYKKLDDRVRIEFTANSRSSKLLQEIGKWKAGSRIPIRETVRAILKKRTGQIHELFAEPQRDDLAQPTYRAVLQALQRIYPSGNGAQFVLDQLVGFGQIHFGKNSPGARDVLSKAGIIKKVSRGNYQLCWENLGFSVPDCGGRDLKDTPLFAYTPPSAQDKCADALNIVPCPRCDYPAEDSRKVAEPWMGPPPKPKKVRKNKSAYDDREIRRQARQVLKLYNQLAGELGLHTTTNMQRYERKDLETMVKDLLLPNALKVVESAVKNWDLFCKATRCSYRKPCLYAITARFRYLRWLDSNYGPYGKASSNRLDKEGR